MFRFKDIDSEKEFSLAQRKPAPSAESVDTGFTSLEVGKVLGASGLVAVHFNLVTHVVSFLKSVDSRRAVRDGAFRMESISEFRAPANITHYSADATTLWLGTTCIAKILHQVNKWNGKMCGSDGELGLVRASYSVVSADIPRDWRHLRLYPLSSFDDYELREKFGVLGRVSWWDSQVICLRFTSIFKRWIADKREPDCTVSWPEGVPGDVKSGYPGVKVKSVRLDGSNRTARMLRIGKSPSLTATQKDHFERLDEFRALCQENRGRLFHTSANPDVFGASVVVPGEDGDEKALSLDAFNSFVSWLLCLPLIHFDGVDPGCEDHRCFMEWFHSQLQGDPTEVAAKHFDFKSMFLLIAGLAQRGTNFWDNEQFPCQGSPVMDWSFLDSCVGRGGDCDDDCPFCAGFEGGDLFGDRTLITSDLPDVPDAILTYDLSTEPENQHRIMHRIGNYSSGTVILYIPQESKGVMWYKKGEHLGYDYVIRYLQALRRDRKWADVLPVDNCNITIHASGSHPHLRIYQDSTLSLRLRTAGKYTRVPMDSVELVRSFSRGTTRTDEPRTMMTGYTGLNLRARTLQSHPILMPRMKTIKVKKRVPARGRQGRGRHPRMVTVVEEYKDFAPSTVYTVSKVRRNIREYVMADVQMSYLKMMVRAFHDVSTCAQQHTPRISDPEWMADASFHSYHLDSFRVFPELRTTLMFMLYCVLNGSVPLGFPNLPGSWTPMFSALIDVVHSSGVISDPAFYVFAHGIEHRRKFLLFGPKTDMNDAIYFGSGDEAIVLDLEKPIYRLFWYPNMHVNCDVSFWESILTPEVIRNQLESWHSDPMEYLAARVTGLEGKYELGDDGSIRVDKYAGGSFFRSSHVDGKRRLPTKQSLHFLSIRQCTIARHYESWFSEPPVIELSFTTPSQVFESYEHRDTYALARQRYKAIADRELRREIHEGRVPDTCWILTPPPRLVVTVPIRVEESVEDLNRDMDFEVEDPDPEDAWANEFYETMQKATKSREQREERKKRREAESPDDDSVWEEVADEMEIPDVEEAPEVPGEESESGGEREDAIPIPARDERFAAASLSDRRDLSEDEEEGEVTGLLGGGEDESDEEEGDIPLLVRDERRPPGPSAASFSPTERIKIHTMVSTSGPRRHRQKVNKQRKKKRPPRPPLREEQSRYDEDGFEIVVKQPKKGGRRRRKGNLAARLSNFNSERSHQRRRGRRRGK